MKFNVATVAIAAMALGVTAAPAQDNAAQDVAISVARRGFFDLFGRADETTTTKSSTKKSSTKTSATSEATSTGDSDAEATTSTKKASATATKTASSTKTTSKAATTTTASSGSSSGSGASADGLPASSGTSVLDAVQTIAAGGSFDGGMVMFDRGASCTGQAEGGESDAVFRIENGGSLSNVIIGPNQIEGVHCLGACTLTNVWWSAVCEDAFTVKEQAAGETTKIVGGGAFGASDKVMQHNGGGTISISDFYVSDFGKLYRACGNCKTSAERHVIMDGVTALTGDLLAGINYNFGDTATITNTVATDVDTICQTFTGVESGSEPTKYGDGTPDEYCIFTASDFA